MSLILISDHKDERPKSPASTKMSQNAKKEELKNVGGTDFDKQEIEKKEMTLEKLKLRTEKAELHKENAELKAKVKEKRKILEAKV